jgi:DNA replication protein DnaC
MIAKTPLIIIDDFGLQPLNADMRLSLLQILEDRFAQVATIVTSQLPFNKWYEYINEPTLADTICETLTANAHKIEF